MTESRLIDTPLTRQVRNALPHWATDTIQAWDRDRLDEMKPFLRTHYWSCQESISAFDVVGTAHPDYQGLSWLKFLEQGKRMSLNLPKQEINPGYYLDTAVKQPTMYFVALDDSGWHVNGDGNHRTAIARFMFHFEGLTQIHGVTVNRYETNQDAVRLWERAQTILRRYPERIEVRPRSVVEGREDTAGWMRERFRTEFVVRLPEQDNGLSLDVDQFRRFVASLERASSGWRRMLITLGIRRASLREFRAPA